MTESTTPRTDAEVYAAGTQDAGNRVVPAAFARTLERELTEGRANHAAWVEESIATTQELSRLQADEVARLDCELAAARQSLSEGISMPRWIVMSETEPEREGAYLIWDGEEYDIGTWRDGDFYRICGEDPPTHWMPPPEAPK